MTHCKICGADHRGPDSVVVCDHQNGTVHLGCCMHHCSGHGAPCSHAQGIFNKVE